MEETISLRELFQTLRKRAWLIVAITVIATMTSGIVSYFVLTPIYQASTQLLVNQAKSEQPIYNISEIQTNLQLINTYNVIMKSPAILDIVKEELDLNMPIEELNEKINVTSEKDSQVVNVTVEDPDPYMAADIANTVANVFQREIVKIMNVDNVNILARAEVKEQPVPVKPKPLLNMAIAFVVGMMTGVGLAFLLEYLDNTIKNEQDVEKLLELPVLGAVTVIEDDQNGVQTMQAKRQVRGETIGS
ncbi:capsular biosynthesis protein [Anoxybacillus sp. LAT_35]|uniref:YveK family protein n=1 Tax=unclassified Anoxybacillus TaxID=2639704 RepID=UPI001EECA2E6|nr:MULTISPECIES: Wzz/FepE/Etk N-terminal domain-containing protein [unclassified Anoxybacillus]MCG6172593.1 capsular biosynthesis protein [Anoxybacillus sp. LAT_11]MCG6178956.1 capsular biosynthesis protein [Anoxybacillus sp. LAT_35]MCG6184549.1 capsular biosynthesis protein [Anoxybacillus sp. LAT_26]MCG6199260.1 capsular biosynthesis protein [Anoxybacillus sp. LAT_38]